MGWIPGSGRSPRGENGNPLQYSCLKNPMDKGAWQAIVQSHKSQNHSHRKQTYGYQRGYQGGGEINQEFGINKYTLLYIK